MSQIPITPMHVLYRAAREMGQKGRLDLARKFVDAPEALDRRFAESVESYRRDYFNVEQPFHPTDRKLVPLPVGAEIDRGYALARILAHRTDPWEVEGASKTQAFRFVDYEVPPLRTVRGAGFSDGRSGRGLVADVLLAGADGTPVLGEIKVATATRYDTDAVMALIQGLALVAATATPQQKQRLAKHYPSAGFDDAGLLALYVFAVKPPILARARYQAELDRVARELVTALRFQPVIQGVLKDLEYIEARWDKQDLRLSLAQARE